jgi:hypothetical protein
MLLATNIVVELLSLPLLVPHSYPITIHRKTISNVSPVMNQVLELYSNDIQTTSATSSCSPASKSA